MKMDYDTTNNNNNNYYDPTKLDLTTTIILQNIYSIYSKATTVDTKNLQRFLCLQVIRWCTTILTHSMIPFLHLILQDKTATWKRKFSAWRFQCNLSTQNTIPQQLDVLLQCYLLYWQKPFYDMRYHSILISMTMMLQRIPISYALRQLQATVYKLLPGPDYQALLLTPLLPGTWYPQCPNKVLKQKHHFNSMGEQLYDTAMHIYIHCVYIIVLHSYLPDILWWVPGFYVYACTEAHLCNMAMTKIRLF